jgi:Zn-dependent protease with chaperone function
VSDPADVRSRQTPNAAFAQLVTLSVVVIGAIAWSTHHLLLVGAPVAAFGSWPGVSCLLVPVSGDVLPHLTSYAFLLAIVGGLSRGTWTLVSQQHHTSALVQACRARRADIDDRVRQVVEELGLGGRVDVADVPTAAAFCYGYIRPRIIVSRGLVDALHLDELSALLLHEREHLLQRDPLKVAFGRLLASGVFFVPLVGGLYRRYLAEKELSADRAAIAAQGSAVPLSSALVALLDMQPMASPVGSVGADEVLEARIDALLGEVAYNHGRLTRQSVWRSALVGLIAILPLLLAPPPAAASLEGHAVVSGCHVSPPIETTGRAGFV